MMTNWDLNKIVRETVRLHCIIFLEVLEGRNGGGGGGAVRERGVIKTNCEFHGRVNIVLEQSYVSEDW